MFDTQREELIWGGRKLTLETGHMARQADGAVVATYGETTVLATVVSAKEPKAGIDFFPLTVNYQERAYAAGRIPGGYFKREGRPTEKETLVSRLIDRPIRPLFVEGYKNDTQVVVTVLSHDLENDPDVVAMVAASAALTLSGVPFMGPVGAARVGYIGGQYKLNPPLQEMEESSLDLVVAGTTDAVLMVESEAKELPEDVMLGAVMFGHKHFQPVIEAIIRLAEKAAKEPRDFQPADLSDVERAVLDIAEKDLREAYKITKKQDRYAAVDAVKAKVMDALCPAEGEAKFDPEKVKAVFKEVQAKIVRWNILDEGKRIDGRDLKTVRPILSEVGVLPRTHGSAIFTRGETQALVVATLGTSDDEQRLELLGGMAFKRFMLHYNFPPFSVNETKPLRGPGRREVGHGALAERALRNMAPKSESFPYTIRLVSDILESNGSSSMASVCGGTLALMDAGVPIKAPVAGIAMGLVKEGDKIAILSDILGDEDHLGDMDFKVCGTSKGITSIQMDIKITGLTTEIMSRALEQARQGRIHILGEMLKSMPEARKEISQYAPRITTIQIRPEYIKNVIGPGGKVIKDIIARTGAAINIEDSGRVDIASANGDAVKAAIAMIQALTREAEIGKIYTGTVRKIAEFGAFVELFPGTDGLIHISELSDKRVKSVSDVLKEGDEVLVKVVSIDKTGKIRLSRKEAMAERAAAQQQAATPPSDGAPAPTQPDAKA
ncbi:MAG TPA: polyribonucleotide nucleotidyltransferase [Microvirga sp.]|nr:polyribonucleotide nucleotidyltransferase [Microvirga sp.]